MSITYETRMSRLIAIILVILDIMQQSIYANDYLFMHKAVYIITVFNRQIGTTRFVISCHGYRYSIRKKYCVISSLALCLR